MHKKNLDLYHHSIKQMSLLELFRKLITVSKRNSNNIGKYRSGSASYIQATRYSA